MNKTLLLLFTFSVISISCKDNIKTNYQPEVLTEKVIALESEDLVGNTFEFAYSKYTYHIKIESDSTVYWKLVKGDFEGASEGTDKYIHSRISGDVHFISWKEDSGLELYNILNYKNGILTTHGSQDGYMFVNPGTLSLVE